MDLSDGLSMDLARMCLASGVGAAVESARLPLGAGATVKQALHGGEDYELLFTAGGRVPRKIAGVTITRIGTVVKGSRARLDGKKLEANGWEHFRR
jgi:thiamine-monophosphate kinase